ncbi:MAG: nuclear transport factor 2 family protein, partial [Chitinophagaceae bacterium]|nr:nuclear transport factor 2 family protein [Chitinophagaceae bacterium]
MKLTKQTRVDLAKAYQCALDVCILDMKAPLRYFNQYIAEDISGFGTAADEKVTSREDCRKMVMDSRKQSKGMIFKSRKITPYRPKFIDETTAQFRDEIIVQIGDKKNMHSLHLWFTTLFKYRNNKWQMVLFHGSMPDAGSSSADTFHVAEAEKKLKELEQVVAQRTADLQAKTRELEIEASLERVRAITMGMNKPGDILDICKVFFTELQSLGFTDLRNTLINFWDDENGQLHDYDYSDFSGGNFAKLAYSSHPTFEQFQKKIRKAKDAFAKLVINKDGLKSWQQRRRSSGEYKDPRLNKISALYYYFYSTGVGALGISTFSPISKEEVDVLKKFRNVFDMAYQRYIDIQKAEVQAREAQIEAALERVRARTMAMQNSNELPEAANVLFQQAQNLGMPAWSAGYCTWNDDEKKSLTLWMSSEGVLQPPFVAPTTKDELFIQMRKGAEEGKSLHVVEMGGRNLVKHYQYMRTLPVVGEILDSIIEAGHPLPIFQIMHQAYFSKGFLLFITYEPVPEMHDTFKRFANVFDQIYTRFLDLQKAEAQAREAQVEAALERVRARAMAMHASGELNEVVHEL